MQVIKDFFWDELSNEKKEFYVQIIFLQAFDSTKCENVTDWEKNVALESKRDCFQIDFLAFINLSTSSNQMSSAKY